MKRLGMGAAALLMSAGVASADTVTFNLTSEFSGAQQPEGSVSISFTDVAGGVQLTITAALVTGGASGSAAEFLADLAFNLDPSLDPTALGFAKTGGSGTIGSDPAITTGVDHYQADGDGKYDVRFAFDTAPPGDRFDLSDTLVYKITSTETIDAHSFDFLSAPAGGHGPFPAAAHVLGIGEDGAGSGWITVPLPQPVWYGLAGLGLAGAVSVIKRRR